MTIVELPMRTTGEFDPLEKFEGMWDIRLASRYRYLLNDLFGKWECSQGRLIVAPHETAGNSWGESRLMVLLSNAVPAEVYVFGTLNLALQPDTWIQPDLNVLHRLPGDQATDLFIPVDYCTMPIEFISPSSVHRDRVEKPRMLAASGVPFYMTVELNRQQRSVQVELSKLVGSDYKLIASAGTGEVFQTQEPFPFSFAVNQLLMPTQE